MSNDVTFPSLRSAAVLAWFALLASVAGAAACGGDSAGTDGSPDAGRNPDAGIVADTGTAADTGTTADTGTEPDTGTDASPDAMGDSGQPDAPLPVPLDHRPDDSQCAAARLAGSCQSNATGQAFVCHSDSECGDGGADGRCTTSGGGVAGCLCTYDDCHTDSDCPTGDLCVCHGSPFAYGGNACKPGNCRVDADCGTGGACSPAHGTSNCGHVDGYYCHTRQDTCTNDSDCQGGKTCTWSATNTRWECQAQIECL